MKQDNFGCVRLRNVKRLIGYNQKEFMRLFQCAIHRRVCGFKKHGACLNHDVGEVVKQKEIIEVETLRHQQSILPRNNGETHLHPTLAEDRQTCYEAKVGGWVESMYGSQDVHIHSLVARTFFCAQRALVFRTFSMRVTHTHVSSS